MLRRVVFAVLAALGAVVLFASPAAAHASLQDSDPANGAKLDAAPRAVTLKFTEAVEVSLGGVRVFDRTGERVDTGKITHPEGENAAVAVGLPKLDDGAYVVTWRVISADSHPVQGAFTFTVGDAAAASDAAIADLLAQRGGDPAVGFLYATGRAVAFAALLVLLGAVYFAIELWPDGRRDRRVTNLLTISFVVLFVTSIANLQLQAVYGGGLGLTDVLRWSVLRDVLQTRFGRVYAFRGAVLGFAVAPLLSAFASRERIGRVWRGLAVMSGAALAATPGLAGHAAQGSHQPYALIADVVHVGAAAVWIGGMVMLVGIVLRRAEWEETRAVVLRYSQAAMAAVVVLVATGLFQSYRQVGTLDALGSTRFGKLLVAKVVLVAAILGVAYLSRRATYAKWDAVTPQKVRRTVSVEAAIAVAVLGLTSLLVNAVPAKTLAAAPQSGELTSASLLVDYTVSPGRSGTNSIHLYSLTTTGQPKEVVEMTLRISLPGRGINPIPVTLQRAGPAHFQALQLDFPFPGRWKLNVTARTSDIDAEVFEGEVEIR